MAAWIVWAYVTGWSYSPVHARARLSMCANTSPTHILRPGSVLIARPDQYDHFFNEAVVLICEHNERGSRGLQLNRETPFTMGEMAGGMGCFSDSSVHRGGNGGADTVLMLHARADVHGSTQIGHCGLYLGGLKHAQQLVDEGRATVDEFKFFYNSQVWGPGLLEKQLEETWLVTNDIAADDIICAKGDRTLHSKLKKRLAMT